MPVFAFDLIWLSLGTLSFLGCAAFVHGCARV